MCYVVIESIIRINKNNYKLNYKLIMANILIATIKGKLNSSIDILFDSINQVGDTISFNNIIRLIPSGEDYTMFFYKTIKFCSSNDDSRSFRIESIFNNGGKYEVVVSPIKA